MGINSLKKIALLAGGDSAERDISIQSGKAVSCALKNLNYDFKIFDPKFDNLHNIKNYDAAFICLHGPNGEDGKIQTILEDMKIPYTGSNPSASEIAMDKHVSKIIWEKDSLLTPKHLLIEKQTTFEFITDQIGSPFIIKPSNSGSSFGISIVNNRKELLNSYNNARKYDSKIIAEKYISGRELTVSILGQEALEVIEILPKNNFYDFEAKYISNDTKFFQPKNLDNFQIKILQNTALKAFFALGCSSFGRVDFLMDKMGKIYLIEVNTIPGMTSHSLFPLAAKFSGFSFDKIIQKIINLIK